MTISDKIRKQLEQPDGLTVEAIEPLADEYGQQTRQVNTRLSECTELLRKGLRSEAIQLASMKPNLLEWCAQLDFPEFEEWMEILKFYRLTVPPLLDREAAHQLQEAIADVQPLEELLRQHRRLAIAKAPLAWRLKILRRLAKVDSVHSLWVEDQKQWEAVRLKQIPSELNKAIESGSISEVQELATELNNSEWIVPRPTELCKCAENASAKFVYKQQVVQLRSIADQFHAAYSEGDQSSAERILKVWNDFLPKMISPPPDDLLKSVEPAIEWTKECLDERELVKELDRTSAALEELLQRKTSIANLQRRHYDIMALQAGIDPILEQRYQTRIAEIKQAERRKTQLTYASIFAFALTAIFLFGFWQWRVARDQKEMKIAGMIAKYTQEGKYQEGKKYIEGIEDAIRKSAAVRSAILKHENAEQQEEARSKKFWDSAKEVNNPDPSKIALDKVNGLKALAKTLAEDAEVKKIESLIQDSLNEQISQQSNKVESERKSFFVKFGEVKQLPDDGNKVKELRDIVVKLEALRDDNLRARTQAIESVKTLISEVKSETAAVTNSLDASKSRSSIFYALQQARSEIDVDTAMEKFVVNFPTDRLARDFSKVLEETNLRKPMDDWNRLCKEFGGIDRSKMKPQKVRDFRQKLSITSKAIVNLPGQKMLEEKMTNAISQIDRRPASFDELQAYFRTQETRGIGTLVTIVDRLTTPPQRGKPPQNGRRSFMLFETWKNNREKMRRAAPSSPMELDVVSTMPIATETTRLFAPFDALQEPNSIVADFIVKLESKKEFIENWDDKLFELISSVNKREELDGQLKEILICEILKAARQGSYFLSDSYKPLEDHLSKLTKQEWVESKKEVNWVLDKKTEDLARTCNEKKAKDQKVWDNCFIDLEKSKYEWIGLALPESDKELTPIEPHICLDKYPDGYLFAIESLANEKGKGTIVEVGKIANKIASFNSDKQKGIVAGRMLYWSKQSAKAAKN